MLKDEQIALERHKATPHSTMQSCPCRAYMLTSV
uniref:Uncharacterized protein n=1 Tax=Arundo donax TaxID=35708 RepID=A0A0A9FJI3_ARUDO